MWALQAPRGEAPSDESAQHSRSTKKMAGSEALLASQINGGGCLAPPTPAERPSDVMAKTLNAFFGGDKRSMVRPWAFSNASSGADSTELWQRRSHTYAQAATTPREAIACHPTC